jgi:carboxylesterase type B
LWAAWCDVLVLRACALVQRVRARRHKTRKYLIFSRSSDALMPLSSLGSLASEMPLPIGAGGRLHWDASFSIGTMETDVRCACIGKDRLPGRRKSLRMERTVIIVLLALRLERVVSARGGTEEVVDTATTRPVVVNVPEYGRVVGRRQSGTDFFGGVPYAAPPVGNLRWAPPEQVQPWAPASLDATHFGPDCWQVADPLLNPAADPDRMSEDCLYLNIFSPAGASSRWKNNPLPVMIWLHGGAFQQGGARRDEYDGRRLAERGTVVVTLNYRLGALGFLVSSTDGLLGNFGLMDQRAALHWVQDNIRYFGGDPGAVTLFGESAGAVMTVLHLMMENNSYSRSNGLKKGRLIHKAIIQSNPLGFQFRSVVVADFIGEALKRSVDCRDLACLRAERVEEIMRAQSSLMGMPRSVGDFFTWGPTLTQELKLTLGGGDGRKRTAFSSTTLSREPVVFRDLDSWKFFSSYSENAWAGVNVSQPLKSLHLIPDDIPIIVGTNKHEGEMFVHGAFPITMSKAVYWMFVGALFRDSASRVLKHYRGYVDQIEKEAEELARRQIEEEENRQFYLENQEELQREYQDLLDEMDASGRDGDESPGYEALVTTWDRGGAISTPSLGFNASNQSSWHSRLWPFSRTRIQSIREERRRMRAKQRALKRAAKVDVDYRPVMSRIIDDYLFRCPTWHLAHELSRNRLQRGKKNNVYVYRFSHSTHMPGYPECWGKSCHMAEIPFVFQAMDIIRSNYSTLGPYAQQEAPASPEYPYTDILAAYRNAVEAADRDDDRIDETSNSWGNHTHPHHHQQHSKRFQQILGHFFGDYFKEDVSVKGSEDENQDLLFSSRLLSLAHLPPCRRPTRKLPAM